jgi:hypothetical protein
VWATEPYMHNGSKSLAGTVRAHRNVTISSTDLSNLSRYLNEIEPEP